jgi:hypothetical protein
MRAGRTRFNFLVGVRRRRRTHGSGAFGFARLAALRFVFELFVVEEKLFACCEEKLRAAVDTFQQPILEFHLNSPHRLLRSCSNSSANETGNSDSQDSYHPGSALIRLKDDLHQTLRSRDLVQ